MKGLNVQGSNAFGVHGSNNFGGQVQMPSAFKVQRF